MGVILIRENTSVYFKFILLFSVTCIGRSMTIGVHNYPIKRLLIQVYFGHYFNDLSIISETVLMGVSLDWLGAVSYILDTFCHL